MKNEDEKFEERFNRLKSAFKCHSDSELAKKMGVSQQVVYGVKKRRRIPTNWLDIVMANNIDPEYILHNKRTLPPILPQSNTEKAIEKKYMQAMWKTGQLPDEKEPGSETETATEGNLEFCEFQIALSIVRLVMKRLDCKMTQEAEILLAQGVAMELDPIISKTTKKLKTFIKLRDSKIMVND